MKKGNIIRSLKLTRWVVEITLLLPVFIILEIGIKKVVGAKRKNLLLLKLLEAYHRPLFKNVPVKLVPMDSRKNEKENLIIIRNGVYRERKGEKWVELREDADVVAFCKAYFHEMRHVEQYADPVKRRKITEEERSMKMFNNFLKVSPTFKDYYNAWWEVDARRAERLHSRDFARFCLYHPLWVVRTLHS